jgi:glycerol-3-phosphate dehydrogenase
VAEAERELRPLQQLAAEGKERLLCVYGGRVGRILELAVGDPDLLAVTDPNHTVLAAEVVFTIRFEFARNLVDILHRRTMTGLSPDLGASVARGIAAAAARELGWSDAETRRQMEALEAYNARLTPR